MKIEITKIERTGIGEDNSIYVAKIPYEVEDEFGNKATLYRKEELNKESLELQKQELEKHLADINEKLDAINSIK